MSRRPNLYQERERKAAEVFATLCKTYGVPEGWTLRIDSAAKRRLGQCRFSSRQVGLSQYFLHHAEWHEVENTIRHELAHVLVGPGHGHNHIWKAKARALGALPVACRNLPASALPQPQWVGKCQDCGREWKRHKLTERTKRGVCPSCYRGSWRSLGEMISSAFESKSRGVIIWKRAGQNSVRIVRPPTPTTPERLPAAAERGVPSPERGAFKNLVRARVRAGVSKEEIARECARLFPDKNFPAMYSTVMREQR